MYLKQYQIAKIINRHPSTVCREIKRNRCLLSIAFNNKPKEKCKDENYHYLPEKAQNKYKKRKIIS